MPQKQASVALQTTYTTAINLSSENQRIKISFCKSQCHKIAQKAENNYIKNLSLRSFANNFGIIVTSAFQAIA